MSKHIGAYSSLHGPAGKVLSDYTEQNIPWLWDCVPERITAVANTGLEYTGIMEGWTTTHPFSYVTDKLFFFTPHVHSLLGAKLSLNGLPLLPIVSPLDRSPIPAGALAPGSEYLLWIRVVDDIAAFELLGNLALLGSGAGGGSAANLFYSTRTALLAAITAGFAPPAGTVVVAGGYSYIRSPGATAIPDMPGWLPQGDVHVEHFGAAADMTFDFRNLGVLSAAVGTGYSLAPWRISGTSDLLAFQAADAYTSNVLRTGVFYAESGSSPLVGETIYRGYFIDGQLTLKGKLTSRREDRTFIWLRNSSVYHSNILINSSHSGVVGLALVGQYAYPDAITKPASHGQMGPIITVCANTVGAGGPTGSLGGPTIYTLDEQPILEDIEIDVLTCRAGRDAADLQISKGAYHLFIAAGVEASTFKIAAFGTTNEGSNGLMICHWGMQYHGGDPYDNWEDMVIDETYHTCNCTIDIYRNIAPGHGFLNVLELSGAGHTTVGDISCDGTSPITIQPGDAINFWANTRQRDKIMKGIRVGSINALNVPDLDTDGNPRALGQAVMVRGFGTVQTSTDFYTGTSINTTRQIELDVAFKSITVKRDPPEWSSARGVYAVGCVGHVDLGAVTTFGYGRAVDIENCHGDTVVDYIEGDGSILYLYSRGGRILGSNCDKGPNPGTISVPAEPLTLGYAAENYCVSVSGTILNTTVAAPGAAAGATETPIVAFVSSSDDIYVGTPLKIGTYTVVATEFISSGVPFLRHTPLPGAVVAADPVLVDETSRLRSLTLSSASGQTALVVSNGFIEALDMSKLRWSGQYGVELAASRVIVNSFIPPVVGRLSPTTDNYTFSLDADSAVILNEATLPINPRIEKHFLAATTSSAGLPVGGGSVQLNKCRIETVGSSDIPDNLMAGGYIEVAMKLDMRACIGQNDRLLKHPTRQGGLGGTSGYWHLHDDGTMVQWIRNQVTDDATGLFEWEFPIEFAATSDVCVTANPTSATNCYSMTCEPNTSTTVQILGRLSTTGAVHGVGFPVAFSAMAIGRWY